MAGVGSSRRVVLGMHKGAAQQGLRQAADLAALLQAELRGLFLKEDEIAGLAAMPFAREFRPLEGGWHAIEREQISRALEAAARSAERSFSEAVKGRNLTCEFAIAGGPIAAAIAAASRAGDILVIAEPASVRDRVTLQFQSLIDAALRSVADVMVVPQRVAREAGPVVALAGAPHDPSVEAASVLAALANERVSIVDVYKAAAALRASEAGARSLRLAQFESALRPQQERLLVVSRGVLDNAATAALASLRRVPVLIVEPREGAAEATSSKS